MTGEGSSSDDSRYINRKLPISCLDMGIRKSEGSEVTSRFLQEIDGKKTLAFTK